MLKQEFLQLSVWRGEIDAHRLREWWETPRIGPDPDIGRVWMVVTVFPYYPVEPLVRRLTQWADQHFGAEGGWIDVDWQTAQLSLSWLPELYRHSHYPFSQLRVKKVKAHRLVPAPPPWSPGNSVGDSSLLHALLQLNWSWQAWFVGAQFTTPWSVELLRQISDVVIWVRNDTPLIVVERSEEFLRLYRPDVRIWLSSEDDLTVMQKHARPTWRFWELAETPSSVQAHPGGLARRALKFPRRWRE
jgi:hypothetical protein